MISGAGSSRTRPDRPRHRKGFICIYEDCAAVFTLHFVGLGQLLFLADGRLFVRRRDGIVGEANAAEREYAYFMLDFLEAVPLNRGLALTPPADS